MNRQEAYTVVTATLAHLLGKIRTPSSPAIPKKAGPPPQQQEQKPDPKKDVSSVYEIIVVFVIMR